MYLKIIELMELSTKKFGRVTVDSLLELSLLSN